MSLVIMSGTSISVATWKGMTKFLVGIGSLGNHMEVSSPL